MFEDSLMESSGKIKTKRGWTTTLSFVIQICLLGVLVLIPLIYTEALPKQAMATFLVAPPPPPPPPPPPAPVQQVKVQKVVSEIENNALRTPTKIPDKIKMVKEEDTPPPQVAGVVGGVSSGTPGGQLGGVIGGIVGSAPVAVPKVAAPQKVRISSGVMQGQLINKVTPQYPQIARSARIGGKVVLAATISKNGTIEGLHVVSGHPMLINAAMDAVRQWRYKPYILNGEPVEVETTVEVNFSLGGGAS